eukprot:CAMPEP_0197648482 /NCGR_PEP_ID=MMETSP1338-20131121/27786_1 /TAXON_ID=43686 ORGANISM="Pelagodinium beii, Strain RCC1491" /NCGR_SAMPLE_ID=MMETSP1338 /ASSEMBLY_ACC=CAM_ASM_000754 /LENGTH=83 /DNA_ID=CAMNT_0043222495 /DNA_START=77 /DNA_END=328 /DNA_ORIENTATION=+
MVPSTPEKKQQLTALTMVLLSLLALLCLRDVGTSAVAELNHEQASTDEPENSMGMLTLFVAGVLTKGMSRFMSKDHLLWAAAL